MSVTLEIIQSQETWDSLPHTFWVQTWEYGEVQTKLHRKVIRYTISQNNELIGYFQMVVYPFARNKTFAYIPYGPVVLKHWDDDAHKSFTRTIREYADKHNSVFTRLDPDYRDQDGSIIWGVPVLSFAYRTSFHQPRGEVTLDISKEESELRSALSKSTKRNLKKSERNNLACNFYYGKNIKDQLETFLIMNADNAENHHTTTHSDEYFTELFTLLSNNPHNFIAVVTQEGIPLAINMYTVWNNQSYCPFGASTNKGKKLGAYYFIKWQSIKEMKKQGITNFNWGGVAIGKNDNNLLGLNQFKLGFGGEIIDHGDLYDYVDNPWWYFLFMLRTRITSLAKSK